MTILRPALLAVAILSACELPPDEAAPDEAWARIIPKNSYWDIRHGAILVESLVFEMGGTFTSTKTYEKIGGKVLGIKSVSGGTYEIDGGSISMFYLEYATAKKGEMLKTGYELEPMVYPYRIRYDYRIEGDILNLFVMYNGQREVDLRYTPRGGVSSNGASLILE